ncbi:MAG: aspartate--tRNA ligase, partial [Chloroflexota bacterium]
FVVPSRLHPGKFYGLPQSPQQLKQILMVSGVDRYFQFARCFRDEDLRADRQPEHTQLDLEMSFAHQSDVLDLLEGLYTRVVNKAAPEKTVITPFPRLTYNEAMEKYATDKPDLRFGMEVATLTDAARESGFAVFKKVADSGGIVRAIAAPGCASYTRKQTDELIEFARSSGAQGLVPVHISEGPTSIEDINEDDVRSVIKSHVSTDTIKQFARQTGAQPGDLILIIAGPPKVVNVAISNLRNEMGKRLELADPEVFSFAFVTDFPLFEWDDEAGGWTAMHHVFSSPRPGDEEYLDSDPGKVVGQLYDLVCNGVELGSGSVRIHDPELQQRMFRLIGYSEADIEERFGHLLRAFEYGTPPHAGMGLGLDRVVMLLAGEDSLREVIAFPKTQAGIDPLFDAPGAITEEQLKELSIRVAESGRT